jgi:uncharacterized membrane protein YbhN (UPF0104 family)
LLKPVEPTTSPGARSSVQWAERDFESATQSAPPGPVSALDGLIGRFTTIWRRWSVPLRVLVTVGLLMLVLVRTDTAALLGDLARANHPLLLAMLVCSYVAWVVNTLRWQRILASFRVRCGFGELFSLNLASVFYGLALPGQLSSEVVKAIRLGSRLKQHRVAYVSILLDRVYGLLGLTVLGGVGLALYPPPSASLGVGASWAMLVGATAVGVLLVAMPVLARLSWPVWTRSHPGLLRVGSAISGAVGADRASPSASLFGVGFGLGIAAQALTAIIQWGVAIALGIDISPLALTWILAVGTIIGMFPISLAGLGVREATYVGLLSLFGIPTGAALTLSLTMFAILLALGLTGAVIDVLAGNTSRTHAYSPDGLGRSE